MKKSEWSKELTLKEQVTIIRRMLPYAKPYRRLFFVAIGLALGVSIVNILLPKVLQYLIDNYLTSFSATGQVIFGFGLLYLFGTIVKACMLFFQSYMYANASTRTLNHIRIELFKKIHTLGMRYFDQTPAGSIVSRVSNDTETLNEFWYVFMTVITGIFAVVSSFIAMIQINIKIGLAMLVFLPILLFIIGYYQKYSSRIYRQMRERLSDLNTKLNESISGMAIIQQFHQEARLNQEFDETNNEYLASRYAMIRTNSLLLAPIINLLYALAVAASLSLFGINAMHHLVEVGLIYAFVTYVSSFFNPMTQMMDSLSVFTDGIVASSRILKIMDHQELAPAAFEDATDSIVDGKVEFRDVTFAYNPGQPVLKNISFVVNPGETMAFVGHTGSGKSSIINSLMRFYEIESGQILLDDKDIRCYPIEELRKKIGLVLQDAFLFYGDITDNIRLRDSSITQEQVQEAARFVQADQFIEKLPGSYQAKVIERGASYSSGQRQLLSFARTIVTNPKILILDEATANIDTETESAIQEGLENMRKNRTTIAIAHRLSTIKDANMILVLDKGIIVEQGTHETLLAQDGLYADMYRLQSEEI